MSRNHSQQLESIWDEEIVKFPRIQTYLKNEVNRQKSLYGSLVNDVKVRKQIDTDKKMKDYDREINLNRILNRNAKYRSIGRNKPPLSNFLEPILVANIRNKPNRIISKITIERLGRAKIRCPKFIKHMREFDDNEFRRVYALGLKPEDEEEEDKIVEIPIEDLPHNENEPKPDEINYEELTEENLAELLVANTDNKLEINLNNQTPLPPIKEENELNNKKYNNKLEDESTPRVLTPASDILDDNLPSYASDEQFGVNRDSSSAQMNLIIPKNQAAQVKFKSK